MSRILVKLAKVFFAIINRVLSLFGRVTVPELTLQDLDALLQSQTDDVLLVDVRSPAEYSVSVIPGAISKEQFEQSPQIHRDKHVVAYCTVGGRSFVYARSLRKQGFNASNFRPSILGWCEADRDLVTIDGEPTDRVHTYSSTFTVPERYEAVSNKPS